MKRSLRRLAAAALTLTMILAAAQTASASWALGTELVERHTTLAPGVTLTTQSLWSASKSDLRSEHYVTCSPGGPAVPMVYSGTYVTSTSTVSAAAKVLEGRGYRVLAGMNGGFFNSDGTAVGVLMTDGVVRSLDVDNLTMVGFTGDGHVFIDEAEPVKTARWTASAEQPEQPDAPLLTDYSFPVTGFNAYRSQYYLNGLYLYNRDFNSRVNKSSNMDCVAVTLAPVSGGEMTMDCSLTFAVEGMCDTAAGDEFNGTLAEGQYMLFANDYNNADLLSALRALRPGDRVTVSVSGASSRWGSARYGLSGLYTLLRDGEIASGLPSASNPYTAIGVREDGSSVFYTIDGRQSGWSVGATYAQVAERLQELGCVSAAALDGGGSTTLGATLPGSSTFTVLNRPSGGGERRVNNSIFLAVPVGTSLMTPGCYVNSETQVVLAGADLPLSAAPYDGAGDPSDTAPIWWAESGSVAGEGLSAVYTAPSTAGDYDISAGGDPLTVHVTDALSTLRVRKEGSSASLSSLTLEPGQKVDLTASGLWRNLPVAMDDGDVTWRADAAVGTIDGQGRLTAGDRYAVGSVTASAGGRTVTVRVTVNTGLPFTDVPGSAWYTDAVSWAVEHDVAKGITENSFAPDSGCTRAQIVTFLWRAWDSPEPTSASCPFTDVPADAYYYKAALWAAETGVTTGTTDTTFSPDAPCTRGQAVTFLHRAAGTPQLSGGDRFADVVPGSYYEDAVAWAVADGVAKGVTEDSFAPDSGCTRAQIVTFLWRART